MLAKATVYTQKLLTAQYALGEARKALKVAEESARVSPELQELALERDPIAWADCLRRIARVAETLPGLRASVRECEATYEKLKERACDRCSGTGEYAGATRYTAGGRPACFDCEGRGWSHE